MKMKFINIFTNKSLEEHDKLIRDEERKKGIEQGIKEGIEQGIKQGKTEGIDLGNKNTTKLWQEEFDKQVTSTKKNKEDMLEDINKQVLKLSEINNAKMKKSDKESAIDKQIIEVLDCIKKYK